MRARIVAWIGRTLSELGFAPDAAAPDERTGLFGRGIGLDSIEVLRIVTAAETEFGVTVEDDELAPEHFFTVGALAAFIESKLRVEKPAR